MTDDRDYDTIIAKLSRKDKYGKDITNDKIGKGGRHRTDGTFSAQPYDIKVLKEAPEKKDNKPIVPKKTGENRSVPSKSRETHVNKSYNDLPWYEQLLVDITQEAVSRGVNYVSDKIEDYLDSGLKKIAEWNRTRHSQNNVKTKKSNWFTPKVDQVIKEKDEVESVNIQKTTSTPSDYFDYAYQNYSTNMTSEEAQKELVDAFILYVVAAKKFNKVANSNIVDSAGNSIEGKNLLDKVSTPQMLENVNTIISNNPKLLDEISSRTLESIIGRNVFVNKEYVPLKRSELLN